MSVKHLLKYKGSFVATIKPDATLVDLVDALAEHRIGAMVVSADGVHIDGIVSERDVVRALRSTSSLHDEVRTDLDAILVRQIMTADVRCCRPEDTIDELMGVMTAGRMRHLPVVVDDELVGIVSIGDVVKTRIADLETERTALVDYVTTGR